MPKLVIQNLKIWILSLLSVSLLFFTFLFLQNGSTLIISMNSAAESPLNAQLFFAKEGQPFIARNSRRTYEVHDDNYYFKLPDPKKMQYVRFDPATVKSNITIKNITLSTRHWFKTSLFDIPTSNLIPIHQIEHLTHLNNGVIFSTTGKDPQFNIQIFSSTHLATTYTSQVNLFLISVFIVSVLLYLSYIYKSTKRYYSLNPRLDAEDYSICQS